MSISFARFKQTHRRRRAAIADAGLLLGAMALALPAAATPQILFDQSFGGLGDVTAKGGTCLVGASNCPSSMFVTGGGIQFKKTDTAKLKFPVTNGASTYINPLKGSIVFDYTPVGGTDGDWGSAPVYSSVLFHLRDSNMLAHIGNATNIDSTLKIGVNHSGNNNYLYFMYAGTSGCTTDCVQQTGTSFYEPEVVTAWQPGVSHNVAAIWDYTGAHPFVALVVDKQRSFIALGKTAIGLTGFSPDYFYVGNFPNSPNQPAQGVIRNLKIYDDVVISPDDQVASYIDWTHDDGVRDPHETLYDSADAKAALPLPGSKPFIFYPSYSFEPIYEGSVPDDATEPSAFVFDFAKKQRETVFFNIYAGGADLTSVATSVSNLTNGTNVIDQSKIKIRSVRNWWQSSNEPARRLVPVYVPELLLYDDTHVPQCTGSNAARPCLNMSFPSDPSSTTTQTTLLANTSKQFALTLDIGANVAPGDYTGTVTTVTNLGTRTLPIKVVVHPFTLPDVDKIVGLYHINQFDVTTGFDNYVSETMYQTQLQDMREHGVNGLLYFGESAKYPQYAHAAGLDSLGIYYYNNYTIPSYPSAGTLAGQIGAYGMTPYLYGQDEFHSDIANRLPKQLDKSKRSHDAGGNIAVAVNKEWAENLNSSAFFGSGYSAGGNVYTFADGKLDLPVLQVENHSGRTLQYFTNLLAGTETKAPYPELYYWQVYKEDPRSNRFYTGYHLWLTDLAGVLPYDYMRVSGDPFNDFDGAMNVDRDLNVVYPSLEGGIDTVEWEAFSAGLNDYRLLKLWCDFHAQLAAIPGSNAATRKATLDALLVKYRDVSASTHVSRAQFAADRATLLAELDGMYASLDADGDGVSNGDDNCVDVANAAQTDVDGNGVGDACQHGLTGEYFNGTNLGGSVVLTRIDPSVDIDWDFASPGSGVDADYFSVRWTGRLLVPNYTGDYEFCIKGDDGVRLWVDGEQLLDFWVPQDSVKNCATIALTANQSVPIQIEFFDATEEAIMQMTWSYSGQAEQVVPGENLYAQ